ncbi:Phosphatidylcholine:diacylglycerol cholinephosphotransferase 1 [Raphanus sativus]|uniref:Phosphatidylcholine:diacylglycerol cholinephosphotransferase 1 n=1 Tax=Raphanus sativus TaxID=3726 RepID=A0A6J0P626_RAPSA|nr:phosphatidylcholine:diacylglycerol cholinephosphotransferase 1 [Raphanus sativus]KAJ4893736.1 Phosphatidylcholine:diacylglycerol cholinephosphotransferase 1 [Raphanus sativus]
MSTETDVPLRRRSNSLNGHHSNGVAFDGTVPSMESIVKETDDGYARGRSKASFMTWTARDAIYVARVHWIPCLFAVGVLFFMGVEYTLQMIPARSEPFDIGFVATRSLNRVLANSPDLNTVLAALNTVFVAMQTTYIVWTWLMEGRPRATISACFMFTCRGILGYSTQLPLPQEFLGSGVDFPVGNVSFFLFYSGHVAGSMIASLDMRRMQRLRLAMLFDTLNVLQSIRLLGTRGHYTIDLAVGVGAGILFDSLAGKYEEMMSKRHNLGNGFSLISKDSPVN